MNKNLNKSAKSSWFERLSAAHQKAYIAKHPNSKYSKSRSKVEKLKNFKGKQAPPFTAKDAAKARAKRNTAKK